MDSPKFMRTAAGIGILILFVLSVEAAAQKCVLRIGAWESYPEVTTSEGGRASLRKATVTGFTSTATHQKTRLLYRGVSLMGNAYYENIPEGDYKITVRRAGFKTTIQSHKFSCEYAYDGFDFTDILVFRGKSTQIVTSRTASIPPRDPNRFTIRGDRDFAVPNPPSSPKKITKPISGGVLNGKALSLPKPPYPAAARAVRASGAVTVQILIDEEGNVISASAVSGHPLLHAAAVAAAGGAKFTPTQLEGQPVKVSGVITYNFVP